MIPKQIVQIAKYLKSPATKNISDIIHFNMDPRWKRSVCSLQNRMLIATVTPKDVTCKNCRKTRDFKENRLKTQIWFDLNE